MKQKIKKIIVLSVITLISTVFLRCQKDDDLVNPEIAKVSSAKEWFKKYESTTDNYLFFQNLKYDWESAELKIGKDGTELIVVPINEEKKDQDENWEQKLYIYQVSKNDYKVLLYEFYPENLENDSVDSKKFTGYIAAWDLKTGFVKSAKFVNNSIVENGVVKVLSEEQLKLRTATNKSDARALDNEEGTMSGSSPAPTQLKEVIINNSYKDPFVSVYFPSGSDNSGFGIVDYTSSYGGGGSGGSGNPIMSPPPPPKLPISDIKKFLSCLNTAASANLTVYAEKTILAKGNVGHAFISISQGNNVMTYGFYPENGFDKSFVGPGIMGNNGGDAYDVSGNIGQISPQQLQKIISLSEKYQNSWYDIDANNCSDFTADVLNIVGVASNNSFETPGTVSKTLEKVPNHTSNPSYAPKTKRTCP